jgi:phage anti-repressor protein
MKLTEQPVGNAVVPTVNARELHAFLEVGKDFSNWIKDRVEKYEFVENQDFTTALQNGSAVGNRGGGSNRIDYHISLDMAKELAMVERNERGRAARKYFIECERQLRERQASSATRSRLEIARELVATLEREEALREQVRRSVMFRRSEITPGNQHISVKEIKAIYAPYLAEDKIRLILNYYGHPKTNFQFGDSENASFPTFERNGVDDALARFRIEASHRISTSGMTVILEHDCLLNATVRVSKDDAISYLGYSEGDFEG